MMLWDFLLPVHAVAWLCLLLPTTVATIVEDTTPSIHYDSTWSLDENDSYSGGYAHRTNISGGTATYSFTGTVITLYGVSHIDGAKFSFNIKGGPSQSCTAWWNSSYVYFRSDLCSISGLDGTAQHTLTVTHTDLSGLWLGLDYFDVIFTDPTLSVTPSSTITSSSVPATHQSSGTLTNTPTDPLPPTNTTSSGTQTQTLTRTQTQTQVQGPSASPTRKSSSPNIGVIAGGVVGGIVGLALICLVSLVMRHRQARVRLETPDLSDHSTLRVPPLRDASTHGSPSTGPSVVPGVSGTRNASSTSFSGVEAMGTTSSARAYHPYAIPDDMNIINNPNPSSFIPPPSLPQMIERAVPSQVLSSSDSRGEGLISLYPAIVAPFPVPRGGNVYSPSAPQEGLVSAPLVTSENPQELGFGLNSDGSSRPDIHGWRSTVGSLPPPSYHTRSAGR